jgi:hypothetical protein
MSTQNKKPKTNRLKRGIHLFIVVGLLLLMIRPSIGIVWALASPSVLGLPKLEDSISRVTNKKPR